jgi:hypothetical protein
MEDEKDVAETEDTATTEEAPAVASEAPAAAGKAEDKKIDVDRLIEDEEYAAQALEGLTKPQTEDSAEEAADAGAEKTIILEREDGTKERVPISQVQNRWRQAKHLQEKYETEAAPVLKVLRENPDLGQAVSEAAQGKRDRLQALLGQPPTEEQLKQQAAREQAIFDRARKHPKLKDYSDEELKDSMELLLALDSAKNGVVEPEAQEFDLETRATIDANLRAALTNEPNEEEAIKTLRFVNDAILAADQKALAGELKDVNGNAIPIEAWRDIREAINDPRHPENFLRFFKEMGEQRRAVTVKAPAARRGPVNARLSPGASSQSSGGGGGSVLERYGIPNYDGKSAEERRAAVERFLESS